MQARRSLALVLLFGDPHVLEGAQAGEDGATDPRGVEAFGGRGYPQFGVLGGHSLHLKQETSTKA